MRPACTIARQVRNHKTMVMRQRGRDLAPIDMRLGITLKQKQWLSVSADHPGEADATGLDIKRAKTGEERSTRVIDDRTDYGSSGCQDDSTGEQGAPIEIGNVLTPGSWLR